MGRGRIFLLVGYMWRAQAAPPEIVGAFNSDDEGGSTIPPEMVAAVVPEIYDTGPVCWASGHFVFESIQGQSLGRLWTAQMVQARIRSYSH